MSGVNKVIIVGRLGNNPEIRYTPQSVPVCTFNVATSERWTDKEGQKQEKTEWHRVVVWRKMAEICAEYLAKGRQVYVEGRLQTRSWEDKNGVKRYTTEIVANTVQFLGAGKDAQGGKGPFAEEGSGMDQDFAPPEFGTTGDQAAEDDIPF